MEKRIITFSANEQQLERTGGMETFAAKTVGYVEAQFTLGDNWSGYDEISAVWSSASATVPTVLDSSATCRVPADMLQYVGEVRVGLVGTIVSGESVSERLTTYKILAFTVNADTDVEGSEEQIITPSQFEQYVEAVHDDALSVAETASDSEAWAAGTRNGVPVASTDPAARKV